MTNEERSKMAKEILHKRNGYFVNFHPSATAWITVADELVKEDKLQEAPHQPGSPYIRYFINRKKE